MILDVANKIANKLLCSVYLITEKDDNGDEKPVMAFDTITECQFDASASVVSYPTEYGINVTDYMYDNPSNLKVKGVIARNSLIGKNFLEVTLGKTTMLSQINEKLMYYKSNMVGVNIQTKAAKRENYKLESFSIPENLDNYNLFEVTMVFKQLIDMNAQKPRRPEDKDTVNGGITRVLGVS